MLKEKVTIIACLVTAGVGLCTGLAAVGRPCRLVMVLGLFFSGFGSGLTLGVAIRSLKRK
jgi:hypothetical protein